MQRLCSARSLPNCHCGTPLGWEVLASLNGNACHQLFRERGNASVCMQVDAETLDAGVVNLDTHPELQLRVGGVLPRERERLSLTVRRVLRVQRSLLRL